jgi:tetratricopeptide (TPR) repeat protein
MMGSDEARPPGWGTDSGAQAAVLVDAARRLLLDGDPVLAVALAEEALDLDPEDVDALSLVADAAPRYGHGEVGVLAARQLAARGQAVGAVEAAALYASCEPEAAETAARACLAARPTDARAWAVLGQALEATGRLEEADAALARAARLAPAAFPPPVAVEDWEDVLMDALGQLPADARRELGTVAIQFEATPGLATLRGFSPPLAPSVPALWSRSEGNTTITLFTRNLCRGAADLDELVVRVGAALQGELDDMAASVEE